MIGKTTHDRGVSVRFGGSEGGVVGGSELIGQTDPDEGSRFGDPL